MIILLLLTIFIYLISRLTVKEIYIFFRRIFSSNKPVYAILSLIFLPGTIVHETAHFVTALVLLLPVKSMTLFPSFEGNEIKLGEVRYEKRDLLRGVLVGIAPFFFGLAILFALFIFKIFPNDNIWLNIVFGYLIFSVSSNMFSSKKDLEGIAFLIPVTILIIMIFYIFNIQLNLSTFNDLLAKVNYYLAIVSAINLIFFILFKIINSYKK